MNNPTINITLDELKFSENLSQRTYNICEANGLTTLSKILDYKRKNNTYLNLRNCGKKTEQELENIFKKYGFNILYAGGEINEPESITIKDLYFYETLKRIENLSVNQKMVVNNLIKSEFTRLSNSSRNVLIKIFGTEIISLNLLKEKIFENSFDITKIKGVGKKKSEEIKNFINNIEIIIKEISESENDDNFIPKIIYSYLSEKYNAPIDFLKERIEFENNSERKIKIFEITDFLIENKLIFKKERDLKIFKTLNFYKDSNNPNLNKLKITRERIRQVRNKQYINFNYYFSFVNYLIKLDTENSYAYDTNKDLIDINDEIVDNINFDEKTNFNQIFINKIFSLFYPDYQIIGESDNLIFRKKFPGNKYVWKRTYLITKEITEIINIEKIIQDVFERLNSKQENDYFLYFPAYVMNYMESKNIDFLNRITNVLEYILFEEFNIVLDNDDNIHFKSNKKKASLQLVYEIIKEEDRPLTVDEIKVIFNNKYPHIQKSKDTIRSMCQRNNKLMHFGRNSTYGLKIWEEQGRYKGGSMHDITEEYLLKFDKPIHINELVNYVGKYREGITVKRLIYNLQSAKGRRFVFFEKNYVGSIYKKYGDEWEIKKKKKVKIRSWDESYQILYEFCKVNNKLPSSSSPIEDEKKLYRFLNIQKNKLSKLSNDKKEKIKYILNTFKKN